MEGGGRETEGRKERGEESKVAERGEGKIGRGCGHSFSLLHHYKLVNIHAEKSEIFAIISTCSVYYGRRTCNIDHCIPCDPMHPVVGFTHT